MPRKYLSYDELPYPKTNESLDAIVEGLDIHARDRVLAIAGSGDQAFAMLVNDAIVHAIDIDDLQVKYMQERARALKKKHFIKFEKYSEPLNKYLKKNNVHLEFLQKRLMNLQIWEDNLFTTNLKGYNKIYLSNALTGKIEHLRDFLDKSMASKIKFGALIYLTELIPRYFVNGTKDNILYKKERFDKLNLTNLKVESELTKLAKFYETGSPIKRWSPIIYRKVTQYEG